MSHNYKNLEKDMVLVKNRCQCAKEMYTQFTFCLPSVNRTFRNTKQNALDEKVKILTCPICGFVLQPNSMVWPSKQT